ncbi:hypothetical protein EH228_06895 [Erwinia endophytica]|uniref:hypothetical protein n=1 Tax=Erwinia endophytica TaxID=1563158 RepID=UPI001265F12A|nr:hypothetical protein [Erwinia endophytica]KAB8312514.1 hypothetical protein EH228_06895 [Erwinia endophytica]
MPRRCLPAVGLLLAGSLTWPGVGWAGEADLERVQPLAATSVTAQALLLMKDTQDSSQVKKAVELLQQQLHHTPDDRTARLFYGYGQLFLAGDFMLKKNYMRAAELSKQGFYAQDQAAEQEPANWSLFYLRARMDAFVPAENGRCVVANKDLDTLAEDPAVPASLQPMLTLMRARAEQSCAHPALAEKARQSLRQMGNQGTSLLPLLNGAAPSWRAEEINDVLLPLMEARP